jgi:hypothetical protein
MQYLLTLIAGAFALRLAGMVMRYRNQLGERRVARDEVKQKERAGLVEIRALIERINQNMEYLTSGYRDDREATVRECERGLARIKTLRHGLAETADRMEAKTRPYAESGVLSRDQEGRLSISDTSGLTPEEAGGLQRWLGRYNENVSDIAAQGKELDRAETALRGHRSALQEELGRVGSKGMLGDLSPNPFGDARETALYRERKTRKGRRGLRLHGDAAVTEAGRTFLEDFDRRHLPAEQRPKPPTPRRGRKK